MSMKRALAGVISTVIISGCAVIPVRERVIEGTPVTRDEVGFIHAGVTTRDSVERSLGEPMIEFPDIRTVAYSWQVVHAEMPWAIPFGGAGVNDLARTDVLLVAYDPQSRVIATDLGPRKSNTIRSHVLAWIEREKIDVPAPPRKFLASPVPSGAARLTIYRRGGWKDVKATFQPAVMVDGKLVAELRKGAYSSVLLAPGAHDLSVDPVTDATVHDDRERYPIETITIDAVPDTTYYVEMWVRWGMGALDPALARRPPSLAEPQVRKMRPTW